MKAPQFSLESFIEKVEGLSVGRRIAICVLSYVLPIILVGYFSYYPTYLETQDIRSQAEQVEKELETARSLAKQYERFKRELADVEKEFTTARSALPEKEEIPSLLKGITTCGHMAGMEFLLFEPKADVPKDFYVEIPVAITVVGDYHHVAMFFDNVSSLNRIVNIVEVRMAPQKDNKGLIATCTAVTYKFMEEGPSSGKAAKGKPKPNP
ncbi:type 4a pilus biogenesis protein PilO [Desulfatirhabdium butyrativorans]|uniref:type 4a pilus biogenesis protein PilO n=1 Tax=Desulfatirhabdium butyrativorans TaxID=340467 RepID=UPI000684E0E3|nr:type 4a pilus biogenesis protein PilO [Desulfatirhabdium butyrativorans]